MSNAPATSGGTDVGQFISDLDGGVFEQKIAIALSHVAASTVDNDATGKVTLTFDFKRIPGTTQVHCAHKLHYSRPTMNGRASEEEMRVTALHVGKGGKLSLAPETQMKMFDTK